VCDRRARTVGQVTALDVAARCMPARE